MMGEYGHTTSKFDETKCQCQDEFASEISGNLT